MRSLSLLILLFVAATVSTTYVADDPISGEDVDASIRALSQPNKLVDIDRKGAQNSTTANQADVPTVPLKVKRTRQKKPRSQRAEENADGSSQIIKIRGAVLTGK